MPVYVINNFRSFPDASSSIEWQSFPLVVAMMMMTILPLLYVVYRYMLCMSPAVADFTVIFKTGNFFMALFHHFSLTSYVLPQIYTSTWYCCWFGKNMWIHDLDWWFKNQLYQHSFRFDFRNMTSLDSQIEQSVVLFFWCFANE